MRNLLLLKFDALLSSLVIMLLAILFIGWILKRYRQPYFIAYIVAGLLLGPGGFGFFTDVDTIAQIGSLGLIMQMFFIGAEIEVPAIVKNIRPLVIGTLMQLLLSLGVIWMVGVEFKWPTERVVLMGFIISLSSSAIILEYLHKNGQLKTRLGTLTTGILILQDFLIVPMIIILNLMADSAHWQQLIPGIIAMILILLLLRRTLLKRKFTMTWLTKIQDDHELQLFAGLLVCFGFAWITSLLQLSAALGAMVAGILISQTQSMKWLEKSLVPFRVFFLSLFFFSIGLQANIRFIGDHLFLILILVAVIMVINSVINAVVFHAINETWKNSVYAGALLSQIGEFSLVLCTVAKQLEMIDDFFFQLTLAVISLTMLLTSVWIDVVQRFLFRNSS